MSDQHGGWVVIFLFILGTALIGYSNDVTGWAQKILWVLAIFIYFFAIDQLWTHEIA